MTEKELKSHFLLEPGVIFLNHGSFGAAPRPVFEAYQRWQLRLERQPVKFLTRELLDELHKSRRALGQHLGAGEDNLVFIPNATYGVNLVARSLELKPGDEILTTDHEYGACDNIWDFIAEKTGARIVRQPIPLPLSSSSGILEQLWKGVTPRTRLIFLSHITSPTALRMPVEAICSRAKKAGILTLIDGAHAPGQIPLNLSRLGADFYTGNCHKWLLAPKGSAFLYVRPERQQLIEPLVVSWGWGENCPYDTGSRFVNLLEWRGTRDPAASLSVPTAIQFQEEHHWDEVRERCHQRLVQTLDQIRDLTGLPFLYSDNTDLFRQMAAVQLPPLADPRGFQEHLYDRYRIEVPLIEWGGKHLLRISIQGYNQPSDLEALLEALDRSLPSFTS